MKLIGGLAVLGMAVTLMACQKEVHLPGERLDPRDVLGDATAAPASAVQARAFATPRVTANAEWPQRGGSATHLLTNPAIGSGTTLVWSAPIGQGDSYRYRIAAEPVVGGGRVFTMDSRALLSATSTAGATLWQTDIAAAGDRDDDATGAGLAYDGGRIYATTGFSQLVALDAASGKVLWRQDFDAGVGGAPTVSNGVIYTVARDGSAWAIRAADGKVLWTFDGVKAGAGMAGVSAPAVNDRLVVFPFASGDMVATLKKAGLTLWQGKVAGARLGRGYAVVSDLTGDPVIVGDTLYAGSSAGKLGAFDVNSGTSKWTANEGASAPAQVAGGSVFVVSDEGRLIRIDAATGETIWAVDMPYYTKEKVKRQREITVNHGPLLAGGKLFVASSDGVLRVFDPASGNKIGEAAIPGGAATDPIVAGSTLYVVNRDGKLLAFR